MLLNQGRKVFLAPPALLTAAQLGSRRKMPLWNGRAVAISGTAMLSNDAAVTPNTVVKP